MTTNQYGDEITSSSPSPRVRDPDEGSRVRSALAV